MADVSVERLRELADMQVHNETAAALRELIAIEERVAGVRPTPDEVARACDESWSSDFINAAPLRSHLAACIKAEREVAAAAQIALEAERDEAKATLFAAQQALIKEGMARNAAEAALDALRAALRRLRADPTVPAHAIESALAAVAFSAQRTALPAPEATLGTPAKTKWRDLSEAEREKRRGQAMATAAREGGGSK